jgi:hypothetical protein
MRRYRLMAEILITRNKDGELTKIIIAISIKKTNITIQTTGMPTF